MSAPFITLTFGRIKEGKRDVFEQSSATIAQLVEAEEPRVIAFHASLTRTEKGSLVSSSIRTQSQWSITSRS